MSSTFLTTSTAITKVEREDTCTILYLLFGGSIMLTATVFVAMEYVHLYGLLFLVTWAIFCVGVTVFPLWGFIALARHDKHNAMWCVRGFAASVLCGAYSFLVLLAHCFGWL